jgi:hypothetical protein
VLFRIRRHIRERKNITKDGNKMVLSGTFKVTSIKKKTKAVFFKDLTVGDEFTLQYGLSGSYGYAPYIDIIGIGKTHNNSASQLSSNLDNFEIEQII